MQNVFPKWFHQSTSESRSACVMDRRPGTAPTCKRRKPTSRLSVK